MFRQRVHVLSVLAAVLIFAGIGWASRNSGGTYSLPAGNPVVTGTVITSTWANTTLNDIKNEITNSLDRQGRGGMLAPLQLTNGTAAAPSLTFTSEPSSGLYRAGAGDERFSVLTTDVWKWATAANQSLVPLTVTGRTTTTDLTVTGTSAALAVVSTTANLRGLSVTGNGTAPGIVAVGGATSGRGLNATGGAPNGLGVYAAGVGTGVGVYGEGGASAGWGGDFYGGATSGGGIRATGGAPNGLGVTAQGTGTGAGLDGTGGLNSGTGLVARGGAPNGVGAAITGTGSGRGAIVIGGTTASYALGVQSGTAATGGTRQTNIAVTNGDVDFTGTAAPSSTTAMGNRLGPTSFAKVFGSITIDAPATGVSVNDGLNIASVAMSQTNPIGSVGQGNDSVEITFASPFANSNYTVAVGSRYRDCLPIVRTKTSTTLTIVFGPPPGRALTGPEIFCSQNVVSGTYSGSGIPTLSNATFELAIFGAQ